jgi:hypothetical protein
MTTDSANVNARRTEFGGIAAVHTPEADSFVQNEGNDG